MSRADAYKKAVEEYNDSKKKERKESNSIYYKDIEFLPLNKDEGKLIRLIGFPFCKVPHKMSEAKNYDPVVIHRGHFLSDNGKVLQWIVPPVYLEDGFNKFILWGIMREITKYEMIGNEKNYKYANTEIFQSIINCKGKTGKYKYGWFPSRGTSWNVIDIENLDWHKENKKSKVLCKSSFLTKSGEMGFNTDISLSFNDTLWERIIVNYGSCENLNLFVKQTVSHDNRYLFDIINANKTPEEIQLPSFVGCSPEEKIKKLTPLLTQDIDEVMNSIMYADLKSLFPIVSYREIYTNLKVLISDADKLLGTNYYHELETLCEHEEKHEDNIKSDSIYQNFLSKDIVPPVVVAKKEEDKDKPKINELVVVRRRVAQQQEEKKVTIDKQKILNEKYPFYVNMGEEFKKYFFVDDISGGCTFIEGSNLVPCPNCKELSPDIFDMCPKCGEKFILENDDEIPF